MMVRGTFLIQKRLTLRFTDVVSALSKAIEIVTAGKHDPMRAHERVKGMYDWAEVTTRTEKVYEHVMLKRPIDLWTRMHRYANDLAHNKIFMLPIALSI